MYSTIIRVLTLIVALVVVAQSASISFPKQATAMSKSGGKGVLIQYDVSDLTEAVYLKCDVLDEAYAWYGYNDGDPHVISGKGVLEPDFKLGPDYTTLPSGHTYSSSCFLIYKAKYDALSKPDDAWKDAIQDSSKNSPICFESSCAGGTPPVVDPPVVDPPVEKAPCDSSPCQNGGTCSNTAGGSSFSCLCKKGFTGSECAEAVPATDPCAACSPYATCSTAGVCTCKQGYTGDGQTCTASSVANGCKTNNGGCGVNALCSYTASTKTTTCKCPTGFAGTPKSYCCPTEQEWDGESCVDPVVDDAPASEGGNSDSTSTILIVVIIVIAVGIVAVGVYLFWRSRQQNPLKYGMQVDTTGPYAPKGPPQGPYPPQTGYGYGQRPPAPPGQPQQSPC